MSNPTMRPIDQNPMEVLLPWPGHMVDHPQRRGYYVLWNGPMFLDVGIPFSGGFGFERFPLANFPNGIWVDLQDQRGQPIPVSVLVDRGAIRIRWS
jgi:hypothetical protein